MQQGGTEREKGDKEVMDTLTPLRPVRRPLPFSWSSKASEVRGRPSFILTVKHTQKTNYPVTLKFFFSAPFVSAG